MVACNVSNLGTQATKRLTKDAPKYARAAILTGRDKVGKEAHRSDTLQHNTLASM
jgi:hypothetical protein